MEHAGRLQADEPAGEPAGALDEYQPDQIAAKAAQPGKRFGGEVARRPMARGGTLAQARQLLQPVVERRREDLDGGLVRSELAQLARHLVAPAGRQGLDEMGEVAILAHVHVMAIDHEADIEPQPLRFPQDRAVRNIEQADVAGAACPGQRVQRVEHGVVHRRLHGRGDGNGAVGAMHHVAEQATVGPGIAQAGCGGQHAERIHCGDVLHIGGHEGGQPSRVAHCYIEDPADPEQRRPLHRHQEVPVVENGRPATPVEGAVFRRVRLFEAGEHVNGDGHQAAYRQSRMTAWGRSR